MVTDWLAVSPALVAAQVRVTPAVVLTVVKSQPVCDVTVDSRPLTVQLTDTLVMTSH
jgi:hypothetical protein